MLHLAPFSMFPTIWTETEKSVLGGVSPDGLHWTGLSEPLLKHNHADTQSICLYDEQINKYVLYTRQTDGIMQRRGINRSASDDFRHFPPSHPVLECNPMDPPDWDFYCNGYSKWPDAPAAHLMRISMYKHTSDIVDVHLAVSRDGVIWNRPQGKQPWISGGPSYPEPYSSIYACSGILETGPGEWSIYLGAAHHAHNKPVEKMTQPAGILRARMRKDGFMSLSSDLRSFVFAKQQKHVYELPRSFAAVTIFQLGFKFFKVCAPRLTDEGGCVMDSAGLGLKQRNKVHMIEDILRFVPAAIMAGNEFIIMIQFNTINKSFDDDVMMSPLGGHGIEVSVVFDEGLLCGVGAAADAGFVSILRQRQKEFAFFFKQLTSRFALIFNHCSQPFIALPQKQIVEFVNVDNMRRRRHQLSL